MASLFTITRRAAAANTWVTTIPAVLFERQAPVPVGLAVEIVATERHEVGQPGERRGQRGVAVVTMEEIRAELADRVRDAAAGKKVVGLTPVGRHHLD